MSKKNYLGLVIVLFIAFHGGTANSRDVHGVGYTELNLEFGSEHEPVTTSVWYPAEAEDGQFNMGPFTLRGIRSARPKIGKFGLIVLSHGTGGSRLNHRGLAHLLAQNGYIVAAPDHAGDYWRDTTRAGTVSNWRRRPQQISNVIDGVLKDAGFGPRVDTERIGAVGHSIGGYAVLTAAGANPTIERVRTHCTTRRLLDPGFCAYGKPRKADDPESLPISDLKDPRLAAVVAIAPVGVIFGKGALSDLQAPVAVHRFGSDEVLTYPWHAETIAELAAPDTLTYRLHPAAHHFAFIDPFPDALRDSAGVSAFDPAGFDRSAFIELINAEIVEFFDNNI